MSQLAGTPVLILKEGYTREREGGRARVHSTSNFSSLAVFKSEVHLSVCNTDNEEFENE